MKERVAMSIAGSDSSAGAGIQADLKAFEATGVYGCTVITAITAQNTYSLDEIYNIPNETVKNQIKSNLNDFDIKSIKIGMLHTKENALAVSKTIEEINKPTVLDPVMIAESGYSLIEEKTVEEIKKNLIKKVDVLTPNKSEAESLSSIEIKNEEDVHKAGKRILNLGAQNVVITGGNLNGNDFLINKNGIKKYQGKKFDKKTHGSGCTFSSAIAGYLAKGLTLETAIDKAKKLTEESIKNSHQLGKGNYPVNSIYTLREQKERYSALQELTSSLKELENLDFSPLVPEVGSNFGVAIENPKTPKDIVAVPGRIVSTSDEFEIVGCPKFGASSHISRLILAANSYYNQIKSCLNIKYSKEILSACKELKLNIKKFDREKVPKNNTMTYGVEEALSGSDKKPDLIYDKGGIGKEPMIRVFGSSPIEIIKKIKKLINIL
ncbi:MAG: Hydroxymethylpyrimidine/phosphomethylpyrimidine kinase ThiD [Candidatus Methanohalarchaeum thermophilum]|uniref:Hydroxymethylpyrimidine/phosphomethylpyrimidine kinase ThiD n=1 Tax=Methanohalarchaeum thermophilum TaxID=1903181 RepID=A0A1Q6DTK5_METT1|nr:MAG: Hydroxymethylpyrimidine/phosphomethylpyrimidine kinase ThiD [Candidatus Methanohalarchaeum thermophilum]